MKLVLVLISIMLAFAIAGCRSHAQDRASATHMTEGQRDSAIARSNLPGARVVDRALGVAGVEAAHSAALDTLPVH